MWVEYVLCRGRISLIDEQRRGKAFPYMVCEEQAEENGAAASMTSTFAYPSDAIAAKFKISQGSDLPRVEFKLPVVLTFDGRDPDGDSSKQRPGGHWTVVG